jgi:hypothetical protein
MKDTSDFMIQKQFDIIYSKSNQQKLAITFEMMALSYDMAYNLIKKQNPHFSHRQIIAKRFKMMYAKDFSAEELQRISTHLENVD